MGTVSTITIMMSELFLIALISLLVLGLMIYISVKIAEDFDEEEEDGI